MANGHPDYAIDAKTNKNGNRSFETHGKSSGFVFKTLIASLFKLCKTSSPTSSDKL